MDFNDKFIRALERNECKQEHLNGGDIHLSRCRANFSHKNKTYKWELVTEHQLSIPADEKRGYVFDDVKSRMYLVVSHSSSAATIYEWDALVERYENFGFDPEYGLGEDFPEDFDPTTTPLALFMGCAKIFGEFTREELFEATLRRRDAMTVYRKGFLE